MLLKNTKLQFLAVLGLGALLGYAAAFGKLNPFQKADAGPADQPKPAASAAPVAPGCCSDGLSKAGMLALADHNEAVAHKAAAEGKKPNILFIMGDDVGWFNIGAYHRGIMSGKTPNLDKLAARRHVVHRLLRRGQLHGRPGQLHHRRDSPAHGPDDRGTGRRRRRHPGPGLHPRHRPQGAGLRHRPVRQEPPRRPEQVSADGARLRRVLRLPVPPRRHVGPVLVLLSRRSGFEKYGPRNLVHCCATNKDDADGRCRAGARSASRRSWTRGRCAPSRT